MKLFKNTDLKVCNEEGQSYGELAVLSGNPDAMRALLEGGYPADAKDKDGRALILAAAHMGHNNIVECFLTKGCDKNIKEGNGAGLLHLAAHGGHSECVKMLLSRGLDVSTKDAEGFQALHCAAQSGDLDTVKNLINAGGNVNAETIEGLIPMHVAACTGCIEVVQALISAKSSVIVKSKEGWIPLHFASQWGHPQLAEMLLKMDGVEVNMKDTVLESTPLHLAATGGKKNVITVLLENGADKSLKNKDGLTAHEVALANGNSNSARLCCPEGTPMPPSKGVKSSGSRVVTANRMGKPPGTAGSRASSRR